MTSHELGGTSIYPILAPSEGLVDADYDAVDMPTWFTEPGEEYGYRPWQHTPLRPYDDPVRAHQRALYKAFERLATEPVPPEIDPRIAHLVYVDFMSGNVQRQVESQANYESWRANYPEEYAALKADPELGQILARAKEGHASPADLLCILAAAPSLRSLDLQVLTMPYGYRRHNVPAMKRELTRDVELVDGIIFDDPEPLRRPKIAIHTLENDEHARGLIVIHKNIVGTLDTEQVSNGPIHIVEQQACVMHASAKNGFPSNIMELLRTVPSTDERFGDVVDYINKRIAAQDGVIPTSTMVYAYREIVEPVRLPEQYGPALNEARIQAGLARAAQDGF